MFASFYCVFFKRCCDKAALLRQIGEKPIDCVAKGRELRELGGVKGSYRPSAWGVKGHLWDKHLSLFLFRALEPQNNCPLTPLNSPKRSECETWMTGLIGMVGLDFLPVELLLVDGAPGIDNIGKDEGYEQRDVEHGAQGELAGAGVLDG